MGDIETLLKDQKSIGNLILNFIENTKKSKPAKSANHLDYEHRIQLLESYWTSFSEQDRILRRDSDGLEGRTYFRTDLAQQVCNAYLDALTWLRGQQIALAVPTSTISPATNASTSFSTPLALEKLRLPRFNGDQKTWETFKEKFSALVLNETSMPAIVKFHHLTTCLEGEAAAKLKGIQITAANFPTAWDTLCRRYDDKLLRLSVQLQTLANLPDANKECSSHVNQLLNSTDESINVFKALHRPVEHWDDLLIYFIESKLAPSTRVDWAREIERKAAGSFPTYLDFKAFLENRVRTLDRSDYERRSPDPRRKSNSATSTPATRSSAIPKRSQHSSAHHVSLASSSTATAKCSFCKGDHFLYQCKKFASFSQDKRWEHVRTAKLCINCLSNKHTITACQSQRRCFVCNEAHHTKLHKEAPAEGGSELAQVHHATALNLPTPTVPVDPTPTDSNGQSTLLTTACVTLQSPDGMLITVRALLDTGSEQCFVSEHLVQALALRRQSAHVIVTGVGEATTVVARHRVSATLKSSIQPDFSFQFSALVLKRLTSVLPRTATPRHPWPHLAELQLADPHFNQPGRIDCILNSGAFASALLEGVKRGPPSAPVAINTVFGWVLFGSAPPEDAAKQRSTSVNHARIDVDLSQALARFWEIEEVSETVRHSAQDEECYEHFRQTHKRDSSGRFVVKLPFLKPPSFSDTRSIASSCLSQLNRRLSKNAELAEQYRQFLQEYELLGHMKPVQKETCDAADTYYLPHHPVLKRDTRKLRVVFNASQRDQKGTSLNDCLHTGPKLQTDVILLIIRWNFLRYVVSCDVVKMFRQFLVHPSDFKYQRILWHSGPLETARAYELQTVTYGTACAPFLANACMLQLADDEFEKFPRGAEVLRKNRYADDFFAGGDTLQEACEVKEELVRILLSAGMTVDKWLANHEDLLPETSNLTPDIERNFKPEDTVSTLGIRWSPNQDAYRFKVSLSELKSGVSKRSILSEIARLYDPVGWLSPVVIKAKVLLQSLWLQGIDWDAPVPAAIQLEWTKLRTQMTSLEELSIPRWFGTSKSTTWELHGFCDASEKAYSAAIYIVVRPDVQASSSLIAAKSKVAPIKVISIPKLELSGAVLLARLIRYVISNLDDHPSAIRCWTDSKIVLAWLHAHPSRWKTFIANRVSEVRTSLPTAEWKHVRSAENPADCATRGLSPSELTLSALWWKGPAWLLEPADRWPTQSESSWSTLQEARSNAFVTQESNSHIKDTLLKFSSFDKIIRIFAYLHRWRDNAQVPQSLRRKHWLSARELAKAQTSLLRVVQQDSFPDEILEIRRKGELRRSGPLRSLLPFLDSQDLLRVGGRLHNSPLTEDERHPVILPKDHHITKLLIRKAHQITLHGGPALVQNWISRKFWIIRARNLIRGVVRRCVKCTRYNAITQGQLMGSLPAVRTRPARPFSQVGLDYAGPFLLRASGGRGQKSFKGYVAIFICMVVKAVHLEVVSDYTTQAFLAAFKRFVARRGLPSMIFSDNGTTFHGADAELQRLFATTSALSQEIASTISKDGVEWSFIPPRAPHFGGLWEASVKSFKRHLKRVIGETKLTYEEFSTVSSQIEACLNSRPLCPVSCNADDLTALTPGHFLVGGPLVAPVEPFLQLNEPNSICSRWKLLSLMQNRFWKRWRQEFLSQLQGRTKWLHPNRSLQVGDLVLFKDELLPPTRWPLARITRLHLGPDGLARVASIRTAHSELRRPVVKLILLPINEEVASHLARAHAAEQEVQQPLGIGPADLGIASCDHAKAGDMLPPTEGTTDTAAVRVVCSRECVSSSVNTVNIVVPSANANSSSQQNL